MPLLLSCRSSLHSSGGRLCSLLMRTYLQRSVAGQRLWRSLAGLRIQDCKQQHTLPRQQFKLLVLMALAPDRRSKVRASQVGPAVHEGSGWAQWPQEMAPANKHSRTSTLASCLAPEYRKTLALAKRQLLQCWRQRPRCLGGAFYAGALFM